MYEDGLLKDNEKIFAKLITWESICLRKYNANNGGYHYPHHDCGKGSNRILAGLIYLNTCIEGGETEFPIIGRKYKPIEGKMIIFPSYFTHNHFSHLSEEDRYAVVFHVRETMNLKSALTFNSNNKFKKDKEKDLNGKKKTNDEGSKDSN